MKSTKKTHKNTTQFIRVESGKGGNKGFKTLRLYDEICVIVPPNTKHYLKNSGEDDLKLYSIYSPPEHNINRLDRFNPDKNHI